MEATRSDDRPERSGPSGRVEQEAGAPVPVRVAVGGRATEGAAAREAVQGSPEGAICCVIGDDGQRWTTRVAGRALAGRGTHQPVELALLVFEPIHGPGDAGHPGAEPTPAKSALEILRPSRSVETTNGIDENQLLDALRSAGPARGADAASDGFFADVDARGRR